jgi:hypothetical protein
MSPPFQSIQASMSNVGVQEWLLAIVNEADYRFWAFSMRAPEVFRDVLPWENLHGRKIE